MKKSTAMLISLALILVLILLTSMWWISSDTDNPQVGKLLSVNPQDGYAYVLIDQDEAARYKEGDPVIFTSHTEKLLQGKLVSKDPWFHRIIAKLKISPQIALLIQKESSKKQ